MSSEHDNRGKKPEMFTIHIDKKTYKVDGPTITGQQLREVADPDIGSDRDLYLEVSGPGEDNLIELTEVVTLKGGLHFFTAPSLINPGSSRAA